MILVVGGTGRLGQMVVDQLSSSERPIRVLSRGIHPVRARVPGVEYVMGDVRDPGAVRAAMRGVSVCVSAMHGLTGGGGDTPATVDRDGNRNLLDSAIGEGADMVLLSVVGAAPASRMELFRMKWAAEHTLSSSHVPWTIVRATAFAETWAEVLHGAADRHGRMRVFGRGDNPINFVAVADVARAVGRAVEDPGLRGLVIEVGGPENLTMNELARRLGRGREPSHIPRAGLHLMSALARPLSAERSRLASAALAMDVEPMAFDPTPSLAAHSWLTCTPLTPAARHTTSP